MLSVRRELLPLSLVVAAWALLWIQWGAAPAEVPSHWGLDGHADAWSRKAYLVVRPGVLTGIYLLMTLLPLADRQRGRAMVQGTPFLLFRTGVLVVLLGFQVTALQPWEPPVRRWFFLVALTVLAALTVFLVRGKTRRNRADAGHDG